MLHVTEICNTARIKKNFIFSDIEKIKKKSDFPKTKNFFKNFFFFISLKIFNSIQHNIYQKWSAK